MSQVVFYSGLNEFCRKYLVANQPVSDLDRVMFSSNLERIKRDLFEHLMLFDGISFKVFGENILLPLLMKFFGEKGFRSLVEQDAIKFVLWNPMVGYMTSNIAGVETLAYGNLNSPAHSDPEKSIEMGLGWRELPLTKKEIKKIVKLVMPLYTIPDQSLARNSVNTVKSAFNSGRLLHYGLDPSLIKLDSMLTPQKKILSLCAEEFVEYNFLLDKNLTSFSEYRYYSPFWDTVSKFKTPAQMRDGFGKIAAIENIPNLRNLYSEIDSPLEKLHRMRSNRNAKQFRVWLEHTVQGDHDRDVAKAYIDSISERKGVFDSAPIKFIKSISLASLGVGTGFALGHLLAGPLGGLIGSASGGVVSANASLIAEKMLEISADLGIDLVDSFALERVAKGQSPRMFFNDLEFLIRKKNPL